MCVWFSFSGDDSLGECSGDGDENDSCVTDGSGDEGDADFSHAAFNYNRDSTGVDNSATPMVARSSRVGVDVQRHVGRTKVAKQRTADRSNSETVRQLQMELDVHGGLVPPPDVFVDGKETCGRTREDHYKFDDTLDYFWQHKKSLQTFKTKTMDTPKVMCAGCAQMMYKTGVRGANDKYWIKVSKEFVSPAGEAFPSFKHTIEVKGNDPAADDYLLRVCGPCRSLHTRFVPTTTTHYFYYY